MHFWQCGTGSRKCRLHYCKEHILDYNIHDNCNPSVSPFLFLASNICNFLWLCYFLEISDGCKFCTIKHWNFKFQEMFSYLYTAVHKEKKHLTVYYCWCGNAMKMTKIYSFLCDRPILAFCFALLGFFYNCVSTNYKPCTNTPYKYRKLWDICIRYILTGL